MPARSYQTFERAVKRGYAVVIQDVRGRYRSDGEFRPYENEGRDGFDTIEWAARQPWSNGAIGTFGLSYPGAVQWLAAVQAPPHLKAMVPAMTFSNAQNFFYAGGTWDMSWIDWIWFNIAPDVRAKRGFAGPKTSQEAEQGWSTEGPRMQRFLPLADLPQLKQVAPYYFDWLRHPPQDPWWDWAELRDKYDRTQAAVLNLSAWYDDNYGPEGATTNFSGLVKSRSGKADPATHLLLGPWVHGVDSTAKLRSGEREFGLVQPLTTTRSCCAGWIITCVASTTRWTAKRRCAISSWGQINGGMRKPGRRLPRPLHFTFRRARPGKRDCSRRRSRQRTVGLRHSLPDPENPVVNQYAVSGAHDYRKLAERADVLSFDTPPLDRDTEITGPIQAHMFISCDCRDLDLWVRLLDVAPDGTALNLMSPGLDVQRASDRGHAREPQWLTPKNIYEIDLDNLITSNAFLAGHRIRVQVSASFFPNFSRNLQNGKSEVTSADMQKSTIAVYSDAAHASRVILPVVASE